MTDNEQERKQQKEKERKAEMENKFTIASWNLCLGLANKKDYVSEMIKQLGIDVCCLQEVEISNQYNHEILSFTGYSLLRENNDTKERMGIYIKNGTNYTRRSELEGQNNGLISK